MGKNWGCENVQGQGEQQGKMTGGKLMKEHVPKDPLDIHMHVYMHTCICTSTTRPATTCFDNSQKTNLLLSFIAENGPSAWNAEKT